jgi:hypothetical protein
MRNAGWWVVDLLLAGLIIAVLTGGGFLAGRNYERINAIAAEPTMPAQAITRAEAWECVARARGWRPRPVREDLGLPMSTGHRARGTGR